MFGGNPLTLRALVKWRNRTPTVSTQETAVKDQFTPPRKLLIASVERVAGMWGGKPPTTAGGLVERTHTLSQVSLAVSMKIAGFLAR